MSPGATQGERLETLGRLAATLAHEIRNTLAGIDGALCAFQDAEDLPPARREIVAEMRERIARTREVVDDVLAYARPPRISLHPWPVSEVLNALRESVDGMPDLERIRIEVQNQCAPGDLVAVDPFHLRLVGRNLIVNAAQACGGHGTVTLTCARRGDDVVFLFHDDGPGIPPDVAERIFEPFFTTRPGGTGLGLPIAVNVIEAHGGRLGLERRIRGARGATFVVALPASAPGTP